MLYGEARLAVLQRKQQSLEGEIDHERCRPAPSNPKIAKLMHEKFRVLDEIGRVQSQTVLAT